MSSSTTQVVTRFAPSPTGFLHIGGARTALFNWLFSRHHGGQFLLRIEDTDRARSTEEAVQAILDGLSWLELSWDGEAVSQFSRRERHTEVAQRLLSEGKAYRCYATPEELEEMRALAKAEGRPMRYDGRWRDRDPSEAPAGVDPVVRLKAAREGETVINDQVQGRVTVANRELDDMVLLRSDGTPTYMLAVVVDDIDMAITHVIRGDDHLTNAFRQRQLYDAIGVGAPAFAHIPLIHGPDGAKLSKRHGALGVDAYRDMGFMPEAVRNYLLRLGWSHGDDEIISTGQAIDWFDLDAVGRSASRFDTTKLTNLNGHYLREADDARLVDLIAPFLAERLGQSPGETGRARLLAGMASLKERAKTLVELADSAVFYVRTRPLILDDKAVKQLNDQGRTALNALADWFSTQDPATLTAEAVEAEARALAEKLGVKLGAVAQPLRAALTGSTVSPPVFEVAAILGVEECRGRIADAVA